MPPAEVVPEPQSPLPSQPATAAARGLTRKIMASVLVGALVFFGLALYSDLPRLRAAAMHFEPSALGAGLFLALGNYVLRIIRWQYYLKRVHVHIPLGESALVFLSGFVMSVTPGKVGEVFKSLLLADSRGVAFTRTAPIVVAERLTDLIALVLLTALGALTFRSGVPIAVGGSIVVGLMVLVASHRGLGLWLLSVCERLPLVNRIAGRLREAHHSLLQLTRTGPMLAATSLSFVAWGMECGTMYFIARGFHGVMMELDAATFAYAASTIVGALAMMPGGLGVTEVGMTGLVQNLGGPSMTPAIASATTILVRVATLWFAVAVGAIALAAHKLLYQKSAHTSAAPPDGLNDTQT